MGSCQGKASDPSALACAGLHRAGGILGRGILYGLLSIVSPVNLTILGHWAFSGFETIEPVPPGFATLSRPESPGVEGVDDGSLSSARRTQSSGGTADFQAEHQYNSP